MVIKWGQFGPSCVFAYPEARTPNKSRATKPREGEVSAESDPEPCENCGNRSLKRAGSDNPRMTAIGVQDRRKIAAGSEHQEARLR